MHVQAIHAETVAPVSKMGITTTTTANVRLVGEDRTAKVSNANATYDVMRFVYIGSFTWHVGLLSDERPCAILTNVFTSELFRNKTECHSPAM